MSTTGSVSNTDVVVKFRVIWEESVKLLEIILPDGEPNAPLRPSVLLRVI
jgi:hypothetical protein